MSTSSETSSSPKLKCRHPDCTAVGRKWEFRDGEYCSTECDVRHEGLEELRRFKYDHCRCFSCFRQLKTIQPKKPDFEFTENGHGWTRDPETDEWSLEYYSQELTRKQAVGRQFLEPPAGKGEKDRRRQIITGTVCDACGQTDHTEHDPLVSDRRAIGRLVTLFADVEDTVVEAETLHREYAAHQDLQLAVGRALQS